MRDDGLASEAGPVVDRGALVALKDTIGHAAGHDNHSGEVGRLLEGVVAGGVTLEEQWYDRRSWGLMAGGRSTSGVDRSAQGMMEWLYRPWRARWRLAFLVRMISMST